MFSIAILFFIPSILLAIIYVYLVYDFYSGWSDLEEVAVPRDFIPTHSVSVIIAARNEENHILACIESILKNNYPPELLEVILVNDHSEDLTGNLARSIGDDRLVVIDQEYGRSGKKQALDNAINFSTGTIIITTDADCRVGKDWVKTVAYTYSVTDQVAAAGPVVFEEGENLVEHYQVLDMSGMMAVTANGISKQKYYLANGANLSFLKSTFIDLGGYAGNEELASGDDMFLIQKIAKHKLKIGYIKSSEAVVTTASENKMSDLLVQRKRWATKSKAYTDDGLKSVLAVIFIFQFSIVANIALSFVIDGTLIFIALFQLFIKGIMDFLFLKSMSDYFDRSESIKYFLGASVISIFIVLYSGFMSFIPGTYQWKGRKVR